MSEQIPNAHPELIQDESSAEINRFSDAVLTSDPIRQYLREIGRVPLLSAEDEVDLAKRIEAGLFATHLLQVQSGKLDHDSYTNEEEQLAKTYEPESENLQILAAEGAVAKKKMLESNLRLVVSIAKRYTGRGVDFLDLIQEGNSGLVRAVEKFDYTKGYKFSTYGTWWVRQAITRGLADHGRTIRLPVHVVEEVNKFASAERRLLVEFGRAATEEELATHLNINLSRIKDIKDYSRRPLELDKVIGEDGSATVGDFIEDTSAMQPEATALVHNQQLKIREAISKLDPRSAFIIQQRFGMDTDQEMTLDEVGKILGLTRERVRQLQHKAHIKLKFLLSSAGITGSND